MVKKKHKKRKKKQTASGRKRSVSENDVRKMQLNFENKLKNWSKSKRTSFCLGELKKELGIYLETDTLHNSLTIGKGRKKIIMTIMQAKILSEMLSHQIRFQVLH